MGGGGLGGGGMGGGGMGGGPGRFIVHMRGLPFKVTENEKEKGSTGKGKGKLVQFEANENAAGPSLHQFEE